MGEYVWSNMDSLYYVAQIWPCDGSTVPNITQYTLLWQHDVLARNTEAAKSWKALLKVFGDAKMVRYR